MQTVTRDELLQHLVELGTTIRQRKLVAIAGAPGSGKSTLSEWLVKEINKTSDQEIAAIVPQDGFHLDDAVLKSKNQLAVKGAPDTFDIAGFLTLLQRLKPEAEVAVPVFDRTLEISRNCARIISSSHKLLIVEGNYLLLQNHPQWRQLNTLFDLTVFIEIPLQELRLRLQRRWIGQGFSLEKANEKVDSNDINNARAVIEHSAKSDLVIRFDL